MSSLRRFPRDSHGVAASVEADTEVRLLVEGRPPALVLDASSDSFDPDLRVTAVVMIGDEPHNVTFVYDFDEDFYTVSLRDISHEAKDRDVLSEDRMDWLTPLGKVQYEGLLRYYESGGAFDFDELRAPEGMILLVKFEMLYWYIDDKHLWAIGYTDFNYHILY